MSELRENYDYRTSNGIGFSTLQLQGTQFDFAAVDYGWITPFEDRFRLLVTVGHFQLSHTIVEAQQMLRVFTYLGQSGSQEATLFAGCYRECLEPLVKHVAEQLEPIRAGKVIVSKEEGAA